MKYSFNTWVYGSFPVWLPSYPLEEVIKRLAIIGYDGVEIGCAAPHAWPDFLNKERRAFLKKTLDAFCLLLVRGSKRGPDKDFRTHDYSMEKLEMILWAGQKTRGTQK